MAVERKYTAAATWWYKCSITCLMTSMVCLAIALQPYVTDVEDNHRQSQLRQLAGSGGAMLLIVGLFSYDISGLNPSGLHSTGSLLLHYGMTRFSLIWGRRYLKNFLKKCNKVEEEQSDLLDDILHDNYQTEYGEKYEFHAMKGVKGYIDSHPITTYDYYRQYIDEIEESDKKNLLTKLDPIYLGTTAGTTGKPKVIPLNSEMSTFWMQIYPYSVMCPSLKGLDVTLCKKLRMWQEPAVTDTTGGLMQSVPSYFLTQGEKKLPNLSCNPMAFDIKREESAYHVQAVFALRDRDLGQMDFDHARDLLYFWRYVMENGETICEAIEKGELSKEHKLPSVRMRVMLDRELRADSERAKEVRNELARGNTGLAKRLWPYIQCARVVVTGSQKLYADILSDTFMKDVPMLTLTHSACEGIFGINTSSSVDDHSYTLAIHCNFFEFIPETNCDKQNPETLLAHQLEVGSCYEIVVTSKLGLYRYRTGDVIKVIRHEKECPVYEFMYRVGQTLNLFWEKTTEQLLQDAILAASRDMNHVVSDFTATEDVYYHGVSALKEMTRCYIVFIEMEPGKKRLTPNKLEKFDAALCERSTEYAKLRKDGSIGALQVLQVRTGTFHTLQERMSSLSPHSRRSQIPRVMRRKDMLQFLKEQLM